MYDDLEQKKQIMELTDKRLSQKEIAKRLNITVKTVREVQQQQGMWHGVAPNLLKPIIKSDELKK